jgi:cytochrome c
MRVTTPGNRAARSAAALIVAAGAVASLGGCDRPGREPLQAVPGGDAAQGRALIVRYGCGHCHEIPGVRGASGVVGAPLQRFGRRSLIAGAVPNQPQHLVRWIVDPQQIEPGTMMPAVGATEAEARDIAAYLYTLR